MKACPYCNTGIDIRKLDHPGLFANYRVCPECGGLFTVDTDTKYRQAIFIVIALISLVYTLQLYFCGSEWLVPSLASYVVLGLLMVWGNRKVYFVPFTKGKPNQG